MSIKKIVIAIFSDFGINKNYLREALYSFKVQPFYTK